EAGRACREGERRLRLRALSRRAGGPAHLVRRDGGGERHRAADAVDRLGVRRDQGCVAEGCMSEPVRHGRTIHCFQPSNRCAPPMFEPENDIERLLIRVSAQPSERRSFMRALLDAEVFTVLVTDGAPLVPGPDGNAAVPAGTKLSPPSATRGEETLLPFFAAPSRARTWFNGDHIVAPKRTRDMFGHHPNISFLLNSGSDYSKEFLPDEVKRLLAGKLGKGADEIEVPEGQQLLL